MLSIEIHDIRKVMSKLLLGEAFDRFQLIEAHITTANTYYIDGKIHPEFYEEPSVEREPYSLWKDMRPLCLSLIKGKQTPLKFKLIFSMRRQDIDRHLENHGYGDEAEDVTTLTFHLDYERDRSALFSEETAGIDKVPYMTCTTGMARKSFTMDRSVEKLWDKTMEDYIRKLEE